MRLEDLKLVQKFKDIYCLYSVVNGVEHEISEIILSELPVEISKKIEYVSIDPDYPDFLYLRITTSTGYLDDVFYALEKVYPAFDFEKDKHENISDVVLRLDDDVIAYLPTLLYDVS